MIAKVRSRAKLFSPLCKLSMTAFGRLNVLAIYVNGMNRSAVFYEFKYQPTVIITRQLDRKTDYCRNGLLILLGQSVEKTGREFCQNNFTSRFRQGLSRSGSFLRSHRRNDLVTSGRRRGRSRDLREFPRFGSPGWPSRRTFR